MDSTVTVCVDTTELPGTITSISTCGDPANGTTDNYDILTGCVDYSAPSIAGVRDTFCILVCDDMGFCDTTIITTTTTTTLTPDTIPIIVPMDSTVTVCVDTTELPGTITSISTCGDPANGTTDNYDILTGCVDYSAPSIAGVRDTFCILVCDDMGFCDTTIITTKTLPQIDTVTVIVPEGTNEVVCIDSLLELGDDWASVSFCSDIVSNSLTEETFVSEGNCVSLTTPINEFGILNSLCIVHTYIIGMDTVYDTTIVNVIVPPKPDTIEVLPGKICLDEEIYELLKVEKAFQLCDNTDIILSELEDEDNCFNIASSNRIPKSSDTVCVILCDEIGGLELCDTTTIIVRTPPTELQLLDPCNCLANESSPGAGDGQFSEQIYVTTFSGQSWSVSSVKGFYQNPSGLVYPPTRGTSPYRLVPIGIGTKFIERRLGNGKSEYVLSGIHVDKIGYSIEISNGIESLSLSNSCTFEESCNFTTSTDPDGTPGPPTLDECSQDFIIGRNNVHQVDSLKCCDMDKNTFSDDGFTDGLYKDDTIRNEVFTICPQNQWEQLHLVFSDFDLAAGDSLYVYDGVDTLAPLIDKWSGSGVSATGGWATAHCDPSINASGCLTFNFKTNGDHNKSNGWQAGVGCLEGDFKLKAPKDIWATADCTPSGIPPIGTVKNVIAATIDGACADGMINVSIKNVAGESCLADTIVGSGDTAHFELLLPIGSYIVTHTAIGDATKKVTSLINVGVDGLVCNDEVSASLGNGCKLILDPDMLLEGDTCGGGATYLITLRDASGKELASSANPSVDKSDIKDYCGGTTLYATVTRTFSYKGRTDLCLFGDSTVVESCVVKVNVKDDTSPFFSRGPVVDTLIGCDTTGFDALLTDNKPVIYDNCDLESYTHTIKKVSTEKCDAVQVYTVLWKAKDSCGKESPDLTDTIRVIRSSLFVNAGNVEKDCADNNGTDDILADATYRPGLQIGRIENGVMTITDTIRLSTTDYVCNYILTKPLIQKVPAECGEKYFVTWSVTDWCGPVTPSVINTQFIHFTDIVGPKFVDTLSKGKLTSEVIELGHFECTYDFASDTKPAAADNCDPSPGVRIGSIRRIKDGDTTDVDAGDFAKLTCDSFIVQWIASDICHTQLVNDTVYQDVEIQDITKPSAVCVDRLNVSLPNEWGARVNVSAIDAGSYDACGIKSKLIRIKGSGEDWAEYVNIGCKYIHGGLQIEMQVIDNKGNENICWLDVLVEDKIAPVCSDLPYKVEYCDKFHDGELGASTDANDNGQFDEEEWTAVSEELQEIYNRYFEEFKCEDNLKGADCGGLSGEEAYQLIEFPCGEIEIRRRHRAKDRGDLYSNYAYQKIEITYKANWKVTLPSDWEGTCGAEVEQPAITLENGACDLLAYEVTSKVFEVPGDACFKMERTYHIINWCKYVVGQQAVELPRSEDGHGVAQGFTVTSEDYEDAGYFTYIQILKVHDKEAPVVTVYNPESCLDTDCEQEKRWYAQAADCSDTNGITWVGKLYNEYGEVVHTVDSSELSYVVSNKAAYYAEFRANDGCSNTGIGRSDLQKFWDCKKPTPYVLNGIAIEMMQPTNGNDPMIAVWASDLDRNSFDNCSDELDLDIRIWHESLGEAPTNFDGVSALPRVIDFSCDYLGTQIVNIYVIDEEDNWDFAVTYVLIEDNLGACDNNPIVDNVVGGSILSPKGEKVEWVTIDVKGSKEAAMTTGADGAFDFLLPSGGDYSLRPHKNINPLNGVSTYDLVLISKHILGIEVFDSPYKHIAADVNKSGSITAYDMVQLRQLILNITSAFPNNESWRFVETEYEFTTKYPAEEHFAETRSIHKLASDRSDLDFIGVKIGDVNGNASVNSLQAAAVRSPVGTLTFQLREDLVEQGQTVKVGFKSKDIGTAQGYQFTMNFEGLELVKLEEGVAKANNFNTAMATKQVITTSWNGEATGDEILFSLTFKATKTGLLSELLSINSDYTAAEAYNKEGELLKVNLEFSSAGKELGFELNQNQPNPFNAKTVIGFHLPKATTATLKVMDIRGKVLRKIKGNFAKGYNEVSLNADDLGEIGVLYYQLESEDIVATKRMIIIK